MKRSYNFYKWRIWTILSLTFVMSLFHRGAIGVVSEEITRTLNLSAVQLGNLVSITFYSYALMQIPAGILLDKFGCKKTSIAGMITTGTGSIFIGAAVNLWMAYGGRLLIGMGTSVIFISVLKSQSIWFSKKEFSGASSKISFIGNLGGAGATFPLAFMVLNVGWRSSLYIMGAFCFFAAFMVRRYVNDSPEELGYNALGINIGKEKMEFKKAMKHVISNRATWRNFFILFSTVGCTTAFTGLWGVSYFTSVYGLPKTTAAFYVSFVFYGLIVGSLLAGYADKFLKNSIMVYPRIGLIINSAIWVYILLVKRGKPGLALYPFLLFAMGTFVMSHILCFTDIKDKTDGRCGGIATSFVNSGEFAGSSVISILVGVILDLLWKGNFIDGIKFYGIDEYKKAFLLFLAVSFIGIAASFIKDRKVA
ncbi:MAG: MFS transporter [Clostridiaceae bacterium]